jgi:hypothetical protein
MKKLSLLFLCFILSYINAVAQTESENNGVINGKVISAMSKNPVPGITIKVIGTNSGAYAKSDGKFEIKNIKPGIYAVQFSGVGFSTYVQSDVVVSPAKPIFLEIELSEKVIDLKGIEVRSSYFVKNIETLTSTQRLSSEEIRRAPGVQEDVIRAAALLPGVGVSQAGRNDLLVRGGAPFENLFIVDNIEIPNINHFGTQGTSGGPLSLINIDFVNNVSFSAGGFGAQYGDKVSSITNIQLRNGNEDKFGGKAVLSATGFGLNLEGPISNKGSFFFSARRSYLDFIFKAAGFGFIPQYWDFQGKFNYEIDKNNTISFLTIGALDDVSINNSDADKSYSNSRVAVPNQKQYFSGLTWRHLFGTGFSTVTLSQTHTNFSTYQNDSNLVEIFRNQSKESETSLKTDFDFMLDPKIELTIGNRIKWATTLNYNILIPGYMRLDQNFNPVGLQVDTNFKTYKNSTYASLTTAFDKFKLTLGGRADFFNFTKNEIFFAPRISAVYQLNAVSAFIFSAGRYYQSPSYVWLVGAPEQSLNPIRADQIVLGWEHTPLEDVKVQIEVFHKWYSNYPARVFRPQAVLSPSGFDDLTNDIPFGLEPLLSNGKGFSRGVELFIQKKLSEIPIYGLVSLSISQTKFAGLDGIERAGAYDSQFILNIVAGWRFAEDWEFSAKFRAAQGLPTTPFITEGKYTGHRDFTQYNQGNRLSFFNQLDARIDKSWRFRHFALVTYLDIQDVYSQKNVAAIRWNYRTGKPEYQSSFGILPSIGVSFEF